MEEEPSKRAERSPGRKDYKTESAILSRSTHFTH